MEGRMASAEESKAMGLQPSTTAMTAMCAWNILKVLERIGGEEVSPRGKLQVFWLIKGVSL